MLRHGTAASTSAFAAAAPPSHGMQYSSPPPHFGMHASQPASVNSLAAQWQMSGSHSRPAAQQGH